MIELNDLDCRIDSVSGGELKQSRYFHLERKYILQKEQQKPVMKTIGREREAKDLMGKKWLEGLLGGSSG